MQAPFMVGYFTMRKCFFLILCESTEDLTDSKTWTQYEM